MIGKKYTAIESWTWANLTPEESNSASQNYDNMVQQGEGKLPVINVPLNLHEPAHFADEAFVQQFVLQVKDAREVLDIGSGDGWPSLRIAPYLRSVTGIDASERRVEVCRANAERLKLTNVKFQQMSAIELNLADAGFDTVVCATAIEQTPDPMKALEQVLRVLKPGGKFFVTYESLDTALSRPLQEGVEFRDHPDGSLGWHYSLKHRDPAWERDYLVKFNATPEIVAAFARARETVGRVGSSPLQVPEIGLEFLEANRAAIQGCSFYELEHFSGQTMKETLEDVGFVDVRSFYSAGKVAGLAFGLLNAADMSDQQLGSICRALAHASLALPAPLDQGQPVLATKPLMVHSS